MRRAHHLKLLLFVAGALCCPLLGQLRNLTGLAVTSHYELQTQGEGAEATELVSMLESAWPQFATFYGKEPKVAENNRWRVYLFDDHDQFKLGMEQAGSEYPGASGGYYSWKTQAVYLYRQPTVWFTRKLLLQMCAHQFLGHATGHKRSATHWYLSGSIHYLSSHAWDGKTVQLGATPALTLENYALRAWAQVTSKGFDYRKLLEPNGQDNGPLHLEVIRLMQMDTGYRRALLQMRPRLNKGDNVSVEDWLMAFGNYKKFEERLKASVQRFQEPFAVGLNRWDTRSVELDPKTGKRTFCIRGEAPNYVTAAHAREDAQTLEFRVDRQGQAGRVGALLDWFGQEDFRMLIFNHDGSYLLQQRTKQGWAPLQDGRAPVGPTGFTAHSFLIERTETADGQIAARVSFDGKPLTTVPVRNCLFGFAVDAGTFDFEQVRLNH